MKTIKIIALLLVVSCGVGHVISAQEALKEFENNFNHTITQYESALKKHQAECNSAQQRLDSIRYDISQVAVALDSTGIAFGAWSLAAGKVFINLGKISATLDRLSKQPLKKSPLTTIKRFGPGAIMCATGLTMIGWGIKEAYSDVPKLMEARAKVLQNNQENNASVA